MIFDSKDGVFHKQILSTDELEWITEQDVSISGVHEGAISLAKGIRTYKIINLSDVFMKRLKVVLRDYLGDFIINPESRLYTHTYGEVKRHKDVFGDYTHTLLIYMSDDFVGGNLHVKSGHNVFKFSPRVGWGICFRKELIHWADCVEDNSKKILLIDIMEIL